ncbi:uncharacterized protein LTR77_007501 [Saxophila tyrrhenica]|uniref:Thioredoxin n=1 Tax=Saxophila tyrrhenica TaxID=1690608 RepID=A0AAV9P5D3_9PEZI|nr:hypothetical protein LTR77_007501 [Saxophila tyrrhenica]
MEVKLFTYDLTRGMARAMSRQLLGIQIDAVYHTSLVIGGIEYFFGQGVQTCYAGTTHHGAPMEVITMGTTQLPMETILEYLGSLKEVYTPESYDLFAHNCNNFTDDFSQFLVGKGIPDHITNLPRRVLDTPFGQMLKPQIDASMRSITQAPVPQSNVPPAPTTNGTPAASAPKSATTPNVCSHQASGPARFGSVVNLTGLSTLEKDLQKASDTAATIFFTSSTCAPCRMAYPMFDQLAAEHPQALFVKVDINSAQDVAAKYQIRATPTFMSFSKGTKQDQWSGADPNQLKANVEKLLQQTFPPHPHTQLNLPTLHYGSMKPVTYPRVPPLDKLMAKLGPASNDQDLVALRSFLDKRNTNAKDAALPDMQAISQAFQAKVLSLPLEVRFAAVDLFRCAMIDSRVSGYFAEEKDFATVAGLIKHIDGIDSCPHNLRLVTIHLACNLFTSPLFVQETLKQGSHMAATLVELITSSLLDASHPTTRVAAASLAFNIGVANYRVRREEGREGLDEGAQVELAASLVETLGGEDSSDAVKALLLGLGYLVCCAPENGELLDLVKALDAKGTVGACKGQGALAKEVSSML